MLLIKEMSIQNYQYDQMIYSGNVKYKRNKPIQHGNEKAVLNNGHIYVGQWDNGDMNGIGMYIVPKYSTYNGQFKNNKMHGHGKITLQNHSSIVSAEGEWTENVLCGNGVINYKNGGKYIGGVNNFNKHGKGIHYLPDGGTIESFWKDNNMNEESIITISPTKKSDQIPDEPLINDSENKKSSHIPMIPPYKGKKSTKTMEAVKIKFYVHEGKKSGPYDITFVNGTTYHGDCNDDFIINGHGTMKYANGAYYKGWWKDGKRDGYGFYVTSEGHYIGSWQNNKRHGLGTEFNEKSSSLARYEWKEDVKTQLLRSLII